MTESRLTMLASIRHLMLKGDTKYVKSNLVIAEYSTRAGIACDKLDSSLWDESWNSELMVAIYEMLIELIHDTKFVIGQGNFGDDEIGPAHPKFTDCTITDDGIAAIDNQHDSQTPK